MIKTRQHMLGVNVRTAGWLAGRLIGAFLACGILAIAISSAQSPPPIPVAPKLLNSWRFNSPNLLSQYGASGGLPGFPPKTGTNLHLVPSFETNAVELAGPGAILRYNIVESNNWRNLSFDKGSVFLWLLPYWSSGSGPGAYARVLEVGSYTTNRSIGWFSLFFDPSGTHLYLTSQTNGAGATNLTASVCLTSNNWMFIALTYSRSNCFLFTNSVLCATGGGLAYWPSPTVQSNGFTLGGDATGRNLLIGQLDWCRTYDSPVGAAWVSNFYASVTGNHNTFQMAADTAPPDLPEGPYLDAQAHSAGDFWLESQFAADSVLLTLHGTSPGKTYQIETTELLGQESWNVEQLLPGTSGGDVTQTTVLLNERPNLFFRAFANVDNDPPLLSISSPQNNAVFNASRVNVIGTATDLSIIQTLTVNDLPAIRAGSSFTVPNVPLSPGVNNLIAKAEDIYGNVGFFSISVTATPNLDGTLNNPVLLQATPASGLAPLSVSLQVIANAPGTFQQVLYDFDGDNVTDMTRSDLMTVTHTYGSGESFPVTTVITTLGSFSSESFSGPGDSSDDRIFTQAPTLLATIPIANPMDLKVSTDGSLYVLSGTTAALNQYDVNHNLVRSLNALGTSPSGIDVDSVGNVFVVVNAGNQVLKFKPTTSSFQLDATFGNAGRLGKVDLTAGSGAGEFNAPFDVAISLDGTEIAVSDAGNNRIQRFTAAGIFIEAFGSQGNGVGQFNAPKGLAFAATELFIVDSGNNRLVRADAGDVVATLGSVGAALGQYQGPLNIGMSERGIYVADTGNNRIQKLDSGIGGHVDIDKFSPLWAISTLFALNQPKAVAPDVHLLEERIYVADTLNNRVLLLKLPVDDPIVIWTDAKQRLTTGDIEGALRQFSTASIDQYRSAFQALGSANLAQMMNDIGTVSPVFIQKTRAEYSFVQTVQNIPITFLIEFVREQGKWKIEDF